MEKLLSLFCLFALLLSCEAETDCCVLPVETNFSFDVAARGCGNFYVYKELPELRLHLYVQADRDALILDLTEQDFDITNEAITVEILQFDEEIGQYACDDVANDQGEIIDRWSAVSGTVSIQITEDRISVQPWEMTYKVTVKLKEVQLENKDKEIGVLSNTDFEEVYVGWMPG